MSPRQKATAHTGARRVPPSDPPLGVEARVFQSLTVSAARALVLRQAEEAGLDPERRSALVLAVSEMATNSVVHAAGWGTVRVWRDRDTLVCEVADRGTVGGRLPVAGNPEPDQLGGYGVWLAEQLCEHVEVAPAASGTIVRLYMSL